MKWLFEAFAVHGRVKKELKQRHFYQLKNSQHVLFAKKIKAVGGNYPAFWLALKGKENVCSLV